MLVQSGVQGSNPALYAPLTRCAELFSSSNDHFQRDNPAQNRRAGLSAFFVTP
jgi:hypothetical protein